MHLIKKFHLLILVASLKGNPQRGYQKAKEQNLGYVPRSFWCGSQKTILFVMVENTRDYMKSWQTGFLQLALLL